jgi:hypothetical protein
MVVRKCIKESEEKRVLKRKVVNCRRALWPYRGSGGRGVGLNNAYLCTRERRVHPINPGVGLKLVIGAPSLRDPVGFRNPFFYPNGVCPLPSAVLLLVLIYKALPPERRSQMRRLRVQLKSSRLAPKSFSHNSTDPYQ